MTAIPDKLAESLLVTVTEQVADTAGVRPGELPPLYETIDPDLLEKLPEPATLTFPYYGYMITVCGEGTVTVQEQSSDDCPDAGTH